MAANVATVAWAGTVCSDPAMLSISLRAATHTHGLIMRTREFVVNVPTAALIATVDYCGVASGRDTDKFDRMNLAKAPATKVAPPILPECPVNIECRVRKVLELGSHTMFVAEIMAVQVTRAFLDSKGRLALEKAGLAAFAHGHYFTLGRNLGHFGFSVRKKKTLPRRK